MNTKYFETLRRCCEVLAEVKEPFYGVYYRDGGFCYADFDTPSGVASYSCNSMEEFQMLCDTLTEDDGESIDDMSEPGGYSDEVGFDPYGGCYTFDC